MTIADRLRTLAEALPTDSSGVILTRADLLALVADAGSIAPVDGPDLTVEQVGVQTGRAVSTVRGWLLSGALRGYKLNRRDWRVPRAELRAYLEGQRDLSAAPLPAEVDIAAWRRVRRTS